MARQYAWPVSKSCAATAKVANEVERKVLDTCEKREDRQRADVLGKLELKSAEVRESEARLQAQITSLQSELSRRADDLYNGAGATFQQGRDAPASGLAVAGQHHLLHRADAGGRHRQPLEA